MDEIKNEPIVAEEKKPIKSSFFSLKISKELIVFLLFLVNIFLPLFIFTSNGDSSSGLGSVFVVIIYSFVMIVVDSIILLKIKSRAIGVLICLLITIILSYMTMYGWIKL